MLTLSLLSVGNILLLALLVYVLRAYRQLQRETDNKIRLIFERQAEFAVLLKSGRVSLQQQQASIAKMNEGLQNQISTLAQEIRAAQEASRAEIARQWVEIEGMTSACRDRLDEIRAVLPSPAVPYENPIPYIDGLEEAEVLEIAKALQILRPLVPYPKWRFDADWENPEMAFRIRRSLWTYFNQRKMATPLDVNWHHGTKLRLYLGNDVSRQIFVAGCIDPNELVLLDKLLAPGMVLMDVGANEGIYSVFASACVGNEGVVWALEPSGRELQRLSANLQLNTLRNVRTLPIALADEDGQAKLLVAGYEHEMHNTLGAFVYATVLQEENVIPLRRLDTVVEENQIERLDLIKLDIEGAELRALAGGRETLGRFRPLVMFEANDPSLNAQGATREELARFLASLSYRLYAIDFSTGLPVSAFGGLFSDNMLAVPEERNLPASAFLPAPAVLR